MALLAFLEPRCDQSQNTTNVLSLSSCGTNGKIPHDALGGPWRFLLRFLWCWQPEWRTHVENQGPDLWSSSNQEAELVRPSMQTRREGALSLWSQHSQTSSSQSCSLWGSAFMQSGEAWETQGDTVFLTLQGNSYLGCPTNANVCVSLSFCRSWFLEVTSTKCHGFWSHRQDLVASILTSQYWGWAQVGKLGLAACC